MTIRLARIPGTDLLFEFVTHTGMVNLCRRGSAEVFTMTEREWSDLVMHASRVRGSAVAWSGRRAYESQISEPIHRPRRFGPDGSEL